MPGWRASPTCSRAWAGRRANNQLAGAEVEFVADPAGFAQDFADWLPDARRFVAVAGLDARRRVERIGVAARRPG